MILVIGINEEKNQLNLSIKNINYKEDLKSSTISETRKGFLPLKNNLNIWLDEKLQEYK